MKLLTRRVRHLVPAESTSAEHWMRARFQTFAHAIAPFLCLLLYYPRSERHCVDSSFVSRRRCKDWGLHRHSRGLPRPTEQAANVRKEAIGCCFILILHILALFHLFLDQLLL